MTHILTSSRFGGHLACCQAMLAALLGIAVANNASAVVVHNYLFNSGDGSQILDSAGTAHGTIPDFGVANNAVVNTSESRLSLTFGGNGTSYATLPGADIAINTYSEVTLEQWLTVAPAVNNWAWSLGLGRPGDAGAGENAGLGYDYFMFNVYRANNDGSRAAITHGSFGEETGVTQPNNADLNDGKLHHIVATVNATDFAYYVDGVQIGSAALPMIDDGNGGMKTFGLDDLSNDFAYLGRSLYGGDSDMGGSIFEFRIHDNAMTEMEVATAFAAGCQDSCGSGPALVINRDTGIGQFTNDLATSQVVVYSISSAAGALDSVGWNSIAATGDVNNGGSIDPNDEWSETSRTTLLLSETEPLGGGGPDDGATFTTSIPLGKIWNKSPFEDLAAEITILNPDFTETTISLPVFFEGNGDEPFSLIDLNGDGNINGTDYGLLLDNHLQPLTGTTWYETFSQGDMDGDLDNDFDDWRIFKNEYIAVNGVAAFQALTGAPVPEPSTLLVGGLAIAAFACCKRARR